MTSCGQAAALRRSEHAVLLCEAGSPGPWCTRVRGSGARARCVADWPLFRGRARQSPWTPGSTEPRDLPNALLASPAPHRDAPASCRHAGAPVPCTGENGLWACIAPGSVQPPGCHCESTSLTRVWWWGRGPWPRCATGWGRQRKGRWPRLLPSQVPQQSHGTPSSSGVSWAGWALGETGSAFHSPWWHWWGPWAVVRAPVCPDPSPQVSLVRMQRSLLRSLLAPAPFASFRVKSLQVFTFLLLSGGHLCCPCRGLGRGRERRDLSVRRRTQPYLWGRA